MHEREALPSEAPDPHVGSSWQSLDMMLSSAALDTAASHSVCAVTRNVIGMLAGATFTVTCTCNQHDTITIMLA